MNVVLGIDPGYCATGWVAIDVARDVVIGCGLIRTAKDTRKVLRHEDTWRRVQLLARQLGRIVEHYEPDALVVEAPMGSQSATSASAMAMAYAIVACLSQRLDVPAVRVQAGDAKVAAAGSRAASRDHVAEGVVGRWPELYATAYDAVGRAKKKIERVYDAAACVWAAWDNDLVRMARRAAA